MTTMRAILKDGLLVLAPESEQEVAELTQWKAKHAEHAFALRICEATTIEFRVLGLRAEACREPINIVSTSPDPAIRPIGNLSATPFELDGLPYASVESFWQSLKFPDGPERRRISQVEGPRALSEGSKQGYGAVVAYGGRDIAVGTWDHWALMRRACEAKFDQNEAARAALLATGERPLTHTVRRDSRTIPGVIMADIWMRIRANLRKRDAQGPQ